MNQCKNLEKCIQSITWAWLAAYGGREMQVPNCKTCNAYQPEGEEETLMANYNIEEVQKIVGILTDADAVMCVPHFAPQRYFSNNLYEIPMGYTITVNFEKLATALWDAGYRKEET